MAKPEIPARRRIVIIGGGIIGSSIAYNLTKLGVSDVVLIEKHQIGSGTTWHSAAMLPMTSDNPTVMGRLRYAVAQMGAIEDASGLEIHRRKTGRVIYASTPQSMAQIHRIAAYGRATDFALHAISPEEVGERLPIVTTDGLLGGLWNPDALRIDQMSLAHALVRAARKRGAQVCENVAVTGIDVRDGEIRAVETDAGTIECEIVINTAGAWAPQIAAMAGTRLPMAMNEHFYVITKPMAQIPSDLPSFRDADGLTYGCEEVGGLLFGVFDENAVPVDMTKLPKDFSFGLFDPLWDQFAPYLEQAVGRIPLLEHAEIKNFINGIESFSADCRFIMGPSADVRGLFTMAGMTAGGITYSIGYGELLAEWVVNGRPSRDVTAYDARRFHDFESSRNWLAIHGPHLVSRMRYFVPPAAPLVGMDRFVRRSPLHEALARRGARFQVASGWAVPASFGAPGSSIDREVCAARDGIGVSDLSSWGKIRVARGAEAVVRSRLSDDLPSGGRGLLSGLRSEAGGVDALVLAARLGGRLYLLAHPAEHMRLTAALRQTCGLDEDRDWFDETSGLALILLRGRRIGSLGNFETGTDLSTLAFGPLWSAAIADDQAVLATPSEYAVAVYERLLEQDADITDLGSQALEQLRIEDCEPRFGYEVNPFEPRAIGAFEVPASSVRIEALTVPSGPGEPPRQNSPVWQGGRFAGHVTSATRGTDGTVLVMASVLPGGTGAYSIDAGEAMLPAERRRPLS